MAAKSNRTGRSGADEAVEDVLDFIREWPSHRFPRLLMVLQAIAGAVFNRYGLPAPVGSGGSLYVWGAWRVHVVRLAGGAVVAWS
jgi:hypothetical protein